MMLQYCYLFYPRQENIFEFFVFQYSNSFIKFSRAENCMLSLKVKIIVSLIVYE